MMMITQWTVQIVLQVRVENIKSPEDHIVAVLNRVEKKYIVATYNISDWRDHEHFLEQLAYKSGRLLKVALLTGGLNCIPVVARI